MSRWGRWLRRILGVKIRIRIQVKQDWEEIEQCLEGKGKIRLEL